LLVSRGSVSGSTEFLTAEPCAKLWKYSPQISIDSRSTGYNASTRVITLCVSPTALFPAMFGVFM
jgi:hypothetical protein